MDRGIYRRISGRVFFVFSLFFLAAMPARAGQFVLVEDGVAKAPVVICAEAPPQTRKIADELADFIEKISGARPGILEGQPEPLPESAVWVGYQPVLEELFPDLDFDFEHPEEILISTDGNHLVIAGRDRWDPDKIVTVGRGAEPWQAEFGTVNAVYTFLRDQLEVRWLWPGETGLDILPMENIAFEPFEHRHHPQLRLRHGILYLSGPRNWRGFAGGDWARFQRLFFDSAEYRGHAFTDWWDRFHESNPEYFALQPDGTRSGFPSPRNAKMCVSNPAVWAQWLEDVEARLENEPTARFFGAASNDANASGHCVCENCLAWDEPDKAQPRRMIWQGLSQEYVSLSDRDVRFGNELARLLRERYPGREYHISMQAYGPNVAAPVSAVPDESIWFAFVQNIGQVVRRCPEGKTADEHFSEWAATGATMVYRPNIGGANANDLVHGQMPAVFFGKIMETFRFIADHNCIGVWFDTINEAWPTQGPFYYLAAHLAWEPYADGYAILDDYYRRGFGAAYEPVRDYWNFMEETREARVEAGISDSAGWRESGTGVYDEEFFRHASGLLDKAETLLEEEPEIYRRRLEHVRAGLEYTRLRVAVVDTWERYLESDRRDEEAAERLRADWAEIWRIGLEHMIYGHKLHAQRRGMHPEGDEMGRYDWKEPGGGSGGFQRIP